jgi:stage IV sporulation protein FB
MSDALMWSPISLGRWFGTRVRVHITFIIFVVFSLVVSAVTFAFKGELARFPQTVAWLSLLFVALALHELGHAAMAAWLDCDQDDAHIWPLGSLVGPSFMPRSSEHIVVALAGPVTSGALFLATAIGINVVAGAQVVWNPFGNEIEVAAGEKIWSVAPTLGDGKTAAPMSGLWIAGWFAYLNYILMLTNLLIPALPFDCGRMLRAFTGSTSVVSSRESIAAPWTAHCTAFVLGLIALTRLVQGRSGALVLFSLAIMIELLVRAESRMLEDGGYFEDGVFGYDFSEGYTSLESGTPKVRPYRESALKRWRRRRSELRRQRRVAREAAEEKRMDEILEKLHRDGKNALSDEEHRFLVRVSTRYRNRTKTRE